MASSEFAAAQTRSPYPVTQDIPSARQTVVALQGIVQLSLPEKALLAAAHHTLSVEKNLSLCHCTWHTNAAITILQTIYMHSLEWKRQLARVYYQRAEIQEETGAYEASLQDYDRAIDLFSQLKPSEILIEEDMCMAIQAAIAMADILFHHPLEGITIRFASPLFYIQRAIDYFETLLNKTEEMYNAVAYAHYLAGILFTSFHFEEANAAFHRAAKIAFKIRPSKTAHALLSDIYYSLGLLYLEQSQGETMQHTPRPSQHPDHSFLYFELSTVFSQVHVDCEYCDPTTPESLFTLVQDTLQIFFTFQNRILLCDLIDALIYIYHCIEGIEENQLGDPELTDALNEPITHTLFAQYIQCLMLEFYNHAYPWGRLGDSAFPKNGVYLEGLYPWEMRPLIEGVPSNVYVLSGFR